MAADLDLATYRNVFRDFLETLVTAGQKTPDVISLAQACDAGRPLRTHPAFLMWSRQTGFICRRCFTRFSVYPEDFREDQHVLCAKCSKPGDDVNGVSRIPRCGASGRYGAGEASHLPTYGRFFEADLETAIAAGGDLASILHFVAAYESRDLESRQAFFEAWVAKHQFMCMRCLLLFQPTDSKEIYEEEEIVCPECHGQQRRTV